MRAKESLDAEPLARGRRDASVAGPGTIAAWTLGTWVGVAMVVVLPATLVHFTPRPGSGEWLLSLAVIAIAGARYAWIVADGRRRLFEMSFWSFTYVFLGIAPLVQLRTGRTPYTAPQIDTTLQMDAMVLTIVGLVAFLIGLSLPVSRRGFLPIPYIPDGVNLPRVVLLAAFAVLLDLYFISKVGVGNLFSSREDLAHAIQSAWPESFVAGLISAATAMSTLVAFIALVQYIRQTNNREWPLIALTAFVGLTLAITVNPIANARYVFGSAALAVAALFGLFATPRLFRITAVAWVIALIVVFPLADAFRYSKGAQFKTTSTLESLSSPDFDAIAQINNSMLYVERKGITDGRQAAGVVLFWVPRRFWPDKPQDTGILIAQNRGYKFENLSSPIWAELYINGGWLLVVVGMFGLGALVKSRDRQIEHNLMRARAPGILACILPFYLMILLRGSLLQAMSYLFAIVGCAVFVSRWQRRAST
ncbi:hypothetical protein [Mycobacterium sp. 852014-52144_SCH5372336]|uniref:hypothetical protein n=1 Tax=Mycobacterium sp. 852014-52144_SCH5372336 TaxID=1834115 RepID=UPI0007FB98ED|nr:hypothetical protein [Mycobacterium sp. 852014-52144_SCH5372336]OBB73328.1 hypothetical protein A5759_15590 [Mycobacterium sp. 852014-52144_SCH5372336]